MRYFEIQIPVNNNFGVPFRPSDSIFFEVKLRMMVGGYSKFPEIQGVWVDETDGQTYDEKMIPYRFALLDDSTANDKVLELVDFAKKHYEQIAIFVAEIGTARIY